MIRNIKEPLLKEATLDAINQLIESHELADKQIKANIMKIVRNSKGPTIEELDKRLEETQLKLIQAANQHQNCNDLTQQVMELREQKEKVQEIESENQVKLHNIDQVSDFVYEHQHGIQEFEPQLVRRLIEKITIFQHYMEFTFKDGEVIKVKIWYIRS